METIELSKDWYIERPDPKSIWFLVDRREDDKAIPFPSLKVTKANRDNKGKLLKQILDANDLLAKQSDIITQVFPPPKNWGK